MMSSPVAGKRHPDEAELLKFCSRDDQSSDYVRRTADWIKEQFPASVPTLLPRLRQLYAEKRRKSL